MSKETMTGSDIIDGAMDNIILLQKIFDAWPTMLTAQVCVEDGNEDRGTVQVSPRPEFFQQEKETQLAILEQLCVIFGNMRDAIEKGELTEHTC